MISRIVVFLTILSIVFVSAKSKDAPEAMQKRFYSWEEGKRSGDEYERNQHEALKRRLVGYPSFDRQLMASRLYRLANNDWQDQVNNYHL